MHDLAFGAGIRAMRVRRGWRQSDLAAAAGVSESTVSRLERGRIDGLPMRSVRSIAAALEVTVEVLPRSRTAIFERVANQAHASLGEQVISWINGFDGWTARPEVSFSHFGERGIVDVLGWHAASGCVLVVELKTEIVDIGELLGTLDRKLRNAASLARGLGWEPQIVAGLVVISESDVNRRRVNAHAATFAAAFPDRIVGIRSWLRAPATAARGLVFFANRHPRTAGEHLSAVRRVRRRKLASAAEAPVQTAKLAGANSR